MKIFLLGSIAFDEVSRFPGKFSEVIKADLLNKLSVSFVVFEKSKFFGGCSGNIAYTMGLLKTKANICTLIGEDGYIYIRALKSWGMGTKNLKKIKGHTALAFITSDSEQNQIAHFAPGVLASGEKFLLPKEAAHGDIILISPENPQRMIDAVNQAYKKGLQVFFDPGQVIHAFSKSDLLDILSKSKALFVNEYEWELLKKISDLDKKQLSKKIGMIFITMGADGVLVIENGIDWKLESYKAKMIDPTGAGDAFRAGVLASLKQGLFLKNSVRVGALMGALSVEHKQCQGHKITKFAKLELKRLGFSL